jgi:GR25 family glycosyltransferase involved in LPS biosynthesis
MQAWWTQAAAGLLLCLLLVNGLLLFSLQYRRAVEPALNATTMMMMRHWYKQRTGVREGFVIALDPEGPHAAQLSQEAWRWLGVPTRPIRAVNASQALERTPLPLYTRYTLQSGRHEHMQIGRASALGCLWSHMDLWALLLLLYDNTNNTNNESILVLEEDAWLDETSTRRLHVLLEHDLAGVAWDILLLETGHITVEGPMRSAGKLAMTWAREQYNGTRGCAWMGTRGYLLRPSGARKLLPYAREFSVQVDALLGLVATFEPDFHMYWTRASIAHQRVLTLSTVHDWCIKCHMPQNPWWYAVAAAVAILVACRLRKTYL